MARVQIEAYATKAIPVAPVPVGKHDRLIKPDRLILRAVTTVAMPYGRSKVTWVYDGESGLDPF